MLILKNHSSFFLPFKKDRLSRKENVVAVQVYAGFKTV